MPYVCEVLCQPDHSMAPAGSGGLVAQDGHSFQPACSLVHEALHGCAHHLLLGSHLSVCQGASCSCCCMEHRTSAIISLVPDTSDTAEGTKIHLLLQEIASTPMPPDYNGWVTEISCNDCNSQGRVPFHILGSKCPSCSSYNTRRLSVDRTSARCVAGSSSGATTS